MGNRAVITFNQSRRSPAIYLHWNGGLASIEAYLAAARELGLRRISTATEREALDWLANMIGRSHFGCDVGMSVYREEYGVCDKDNGDNGVYLLGSDMTVIGRKYEERALGGRGEEVNAAKTATITEYILQRHPQYTGPQPVEPAANDDVIHMAPRKGCK